MEKLEGFDESFDALFDRRNTLLVKHADQGLHGTVNDIDDWSSNVGDGESTFWVR